MVHLPEGCGPLLKIFMCRSSTDIEVHCGLHISRNMENEKLRSAATCVSALLTLEFITLECWEYISNGK